MSATVLLGAVLLNCRALPSIAPRKNRISDILHLPGSIRDAGFGGRRESVAGARCRCGFRESWDVAW